MDISSRPVVVKRMPERVNSRVAREFLRDVQPFLTTDRPQIVFDLSQVRQLDVGPGRTAVEGGVCPARGVVATLCDG